MAKIEGEIVIGRPIDVVFDMVADQRNEPTCNTAMTHSEKLTAGPIGVGTQFRAITASRRRPIDMLIEYTAYDRGEHARVDHPHGHRRHSRHPHLSLRNRPAP